MKTQTVTQTKINPKEQNTKRNWSVDEGERQDIQVDIQEHRSRHGAACQRQDGSETDHGKEPTTTTARQD